MQLGITDARRKQTLFTMGVENILFKENKVILLPNKAIKHSNLNRPLDPLIYQYSESFQQGIVNCLEILLTCSKDAGETSSERTFNQLWKVT